jgi:hypothetical protein
MSTTLLITTIIAYVLSLAASLILALTAKKMQPDSIRVPVIFHLVLLFISAILWISALANDLLPWLILITFCSGLSMAGWALRSGQLKWPVKLYFGLYFSSVFLFLASPSRLFYTIAGKSAAYRKEKEFKLRDNYYLVEQQSLVSTNKSIEDWKVTQKFGIYNKTIRRDIRFKGNPDSIRLLRLKPDTMIIRAYHLTNGMPDSSENGFRPSVKKQSITKQKR